jgi:hypothetical protein
MLEDDRHLIQQVAVEYSGDRTLTKLADKDGNQQSRQYQTMQRRRRLCGVFVGLPLSYNSPAEMSLQESDQSDESLLTLQVSLSPGIYSWYEYCIPWRWREPHRAQPLLQSAC